MGESLIGRVMLGNEMAGIWLQVGTLVPGCWEKRVCKHLCLVGRIRTISGAENVIVLPKHYIYRACELRLGSGYRSERKKLSKNNGLSGIKLTLEYYGALSKHYHKRIGNE